MKKKIALIFTLVAVSLMTFAACADEDSAPSSDSVTEQSAEISETENTESSTEADKAENDESESNPLMPIIEKITSESEWPVLEAVTDSTILSEYFLLDSGNENYRNFIVMQCPISAIMSEIIIIEANDVTAAEEDLNARRQKAVDQDAWYPNDVETANSSIVGAIGDYAYFIIGENADEAEEIITTYFREKSE